MGLFSAGATVPKAAAGAVRRSGRVSVEPTDDESSLLMRAVGRPALSGLSMAGSFLDTPGSMVRDVIGGIGTGNWSKYNPFDQLLSPFSQENRVDGRDLLTDVGLMRKNRETGIGGWLSDPGEGARDLAGFGFELLTDPLSYWTGGLTKSGLVAKRAGLLDEVGRHAAAIKVGPRAARNSTTLDTLIAKNADPAMARSAADEAAKAMGTSVDDLTNAAEPVGRSFGVGLPLGDPIWTFNAGKLGPTWDRALDATGAFLKNTAPVRAARMLFDPSVGGEFDRIPQQINELAYADKKVAGSLARHEHMKAFEAMDQVFKDFDAEFGDGIRKSVVSDVDPRDLDTALDDVINRRMAEWSHPSMAYDRDFRQKNLSVVNSLRRGQDPHGITGFDELRQEYGISTGIELDEAAFTDMLMKSDPRPTRTMAEVVREASANVLNRQLKEVEVRGPNRSRVLEQVQAVPEFAKSADSAAAIMDARARMWAKTTGKGADEWYGRIAEVKKSSPADLAGKKDVLEQPDLDLLRSQMPDTPKVNAILDEIDSLVKSGKGVEDAGIAENLIHQASGTMHKTATKNLERTWNKWEGTGSKIDDALSEAGAVEPAEFANFDKAFDVAGVHVRKVLGDAERLVQESGFKATASDILDDARKIAESGEADSITHAVYQATAKVMNEDAFYERVGKFVGDNLQDVLYQPGARGAVEFAKDGKAVIHAFTGADVSTLIHEVSHVFRRDLAELNGDLLRKAETAIGVKSGAKWSREAEEKFASGFERYLRDGHAPTEQLKGAFEQFKDWLTNIYRSIVGTPLEQQVSLELKRVFDEMLGSKLDDGLNGHKFGGGDVVIAGDRGNYGYVQRVGPKTSEVFFRNPETGATANRIMPNDELTQAFPRGSEEAEQFANLQTRKIFDDIVRMTAETKDVHGAFNEIAGMPLPSSSKIGDAIAARAEEMQAANAAIHGAIESKGGKAAWLKRGDDDLGIEHFPRSVDQKVAKESTGSARLARSSGNMKGRTVETRDIPAAIVNRMLREKRYRGEGAAKKIHDDFGQYLNSRWGEEADSFNFGSFDEADNAAGKMEHAKALEAWLSGRSKTDLYTRQTLDDFLRYQQGAQLVSRTLEAVHEVFKRHAGEGEATLESAFRAAGMDPERSIEHFAKKFGMSADQAKGMRVPEEIVQQVRGLTKVTDSPDWAQAIGDSIDDFNRMFKTWVTVPFPSFAARNLTSGQHVNLASGLVNGPKDLAAYGSAFKDAHALQKTARTPDKLSKADRDLLREMTAFDVISNRGYQDVELGSPAGKVMEDPLLGGVPQSPLDLSATRQQAAQEVGDSPSVLDRVPGGMKVRRAAKTWADTGSKINQQVEWQNRATMFIYLRKKGYSAQAAAKEVEKLQFNYSDMSSFERNVMRRAMPFYSFTRKVVPMLVNSLRERPGGAWGMTIRAGEKGRSKEPQPDYIGTTASIPLGESPDGTQSFVTGLGLAHEVPLGFLGGDGIGANVRSVEQEALGMMNPLAKAPLEWATGQSFFQKGRAIEDLDPPLGRTLSNLGVTSVGPNGRPGPLFGSDLLEHVAANSPASRLISTARTVTDSRKRGSAGAIGKMAANLLTGVNVTDVSPARQDAAIREAASKIARESGAASFETTRYPQALIDEVEKSDPEKAERMVAFNKLMGHLAKRAKARKKAG